MLGKIEGKRKKGKQKIRWLYNTTDSMDMNLSKLWQTAWRAAIHGVAKNWTQLIGQTVTTNSEMS